MKPFALQAITTKYHGPNNYRDARVSARCASGRITLGWNRALDSAENHAGAALELARKLGWDDREWHLGALHDGGYVAVQLPHDRGSKINDEKR